MLTFWFIKNQLEMEPVYSSADVIDAVDFERGNFNSYPATGTYLTKHIRNYLNGASIIYIERDERK